MATPKLAFHKTRKLWYARFDGRMLYFGKDYAEAAQRFAETVARWQTGEPVTKPTGKDSLTLWEAADRYLAYCRDYYGPTSETGNVQQALRDLCVLYGREPLANLSPKKLKTLQTRLVQEDRLSRAGINRVTGIVKRFAKWCAGEELCGPQVYHALCCVPGLRRGKTAARETEPVRPVPIEVVEAVKPHVAKPVAALIDLQLLTGARPGELIHLTPADVDTSGEIWAVRPEQHKTAHRGRERVIFLGPRAQAVIKPFLLRDREAYLFNPKDALAEYSAKASVHRRPNQKPNPRKTARRVRDHYSIASYRHAIHKGCDKADVPRFSPYRLRHSAATLIRQRYGLEAAQVVLGHAELGVTQVYAERDLQKAAQVIAEFG